MVAPGRWFIHRVLLALKFLSGYVHRGTLPQSRFRSTAPSGREPGMGAYRSSCRPKTVSGRAIFIAPTKALIFLPLTFIEVHSLSLAFARQLPQGGSREWVRTIQRAARKPGCFGRFSSPLRNSEWVTFHRSTGYLLNHGGGGRFSSPLRDSEWVTFRRSLGVCCGYGISIQSNLNTKM